MALWFLVKGVRNSSEIQINKNLKYQSVMTLDKKISWGGRSHYDSPLVKTLEIASEGLLCGSFDANHHTEVLDRLEIEDEL